MHNFALILPLCYYAGLAVVCLLIYFHDLQVAARKAIAATDEAERAAENAAIADARAREQYQTFPEAINKTKQLYAEFADDWRIKDWLLRAETCFQTASGHIERGEMQALQVPMQDAFISLEWIEERFAKLQCERVARKQLHGTESSSSK